MRARAVKSGLTFEYLMWLFTRISGLVLILLATVTITMAFIMGARTQMDQPTLMRWTFFPNPNHVVTSDIPDITLGWSNAFWQIMQILIIFFAATHGFNGLRVVVEDFTRHTFLRSFFRGLVFLLWIFSLILAIYVILTS